jgi:hypothetical protein
MKINYYFKKLKEKKTLVHRPHDFEEQTLLGSNLIYIIIQVTSYNFTPVLGPERPIRWT